MKTACILTTVNVPHVLRIYQKFGAGVKFFIALDTNSPFEELAKFGNDPQFSWLTPQFQEKWKSSELVGWKTDSRRNFALLEALAWGADIIVSLDDDMIPMTPDFFTTIERVMTQPWSGLKGTTHHKDDWFDAGALTEPQARQRGLPLERALAGFNECAVDVQIGVMQCAIMGIPDTDALTAATVHPFIHSMSDILRAGLVVDLDIKAVFNSQLTVFRRELAPAFFQHYKTQKRNTDIIASVIMRRLMRDRELYTYYGPPVGFHARSPRPIINDLQAEMWGIEKIEPFADYLDRTNVIVKGDSVVQQLRAMWTDILTFGLIPHEAAHAALAFLDDAEAVL